MSIEERGYLLKHQAHDAAELLWRWQAAARNAGWKVTVIHQAGRFPVISCQSPAGPKTPGLYISSGIHGDEPAAPWGLLQWFETRIRALDDHNIVIVPCLNPAGLAANTRVDGDGIDLNRTFHDTAHPLVAAWRKLLDGRQFRLAVCLHEDYDAQGIYAYELFQRGQLPLASRLLGPVEKIIGRDLRKSIDARRATNGIIRRSRIPPKLPGYPEAIALHLSCSGHCITFETPSEFSLFLRVKAHQTFLRAVGREVFGVAGGD
ncbi:MAG: M14 family metallopeptidase [Verrucomicrobiales bacterium]